jgi:hypothetical protein
VLISLCYLGYLGMRLTSAAAAFSSCSRSMRITDARGRFPTSKSLGKLLTGQINRYRGPYVLRSEQDKHSKIRTWHVEERSE